MKDQYINYRGSSNMEKFTLSLFDKGTSKEMLTMMFVYKYDVI